MTGREGDGNAQGRPPGQPAVPRLPLRAGPLRPSPRAWRPRHQLPQPPQDPRRQDLTPRHAQVTIREIRRPAPRHWHIRRTDVITVLLAAATVVALLVR
jgi:hypothetical protein